MTARQAPQSARSVKWLCVGVFFACFRSCVAGVHGVTGGGVGAVGVEGVWGGIHLSGVIVALCNRGLGVSVHSAISQIRVIHLPRVSVRSPAAPLIAALIHFPQS